MAQKVTGFIKLQIPAGKATPAPPVGPALGQHGVNIMAFTKEFNERTKGDAGLIIPVVITVYADRSFTFVTKNKIVSAPFAIVGSIGVVAQIPNFNRFLKGKDIDIELHTAGQYKRTLTLLGENTEEGREKFREELNETHQLFKDFVKRMRPSLDIEQVATGEHWYGQQAVEKGLVDEINTSDEVILSLMEGREVVNVRYMQRKRLIDRFTGSAAESADRLLLRWWQRGQKPLM